MSKIFINIENNVINIANNIFQLDIFLKIYQDFILPDNIYEIECNADPLQRQYIKDKNQNLYGINENLRNNFLQYIDRVEEIRNAILEYYKPIFSFDKDGNFLQVVNTANEFTTEKEPPKCEKGTKAVFNIKNKEWEVVDIEIEGKYYKKETNKLCTKIKLKDIEQYSTSHQLYSQIKEKIEKFYFEYRFFSIISDDFNNIEVNCFAGQDDIFFDNIKYFGYNSLQLFRNEISPMFIDEDHNISSTKFEGSKPLEPNVIWEFHPGKTLIGIGYFKTVENPYFFMDEVA